MVFSGYIIGGFAIFFHSLFLGTAFIGFIMAIVSSGVILGIVSENAGSDPMFESLLSLGAGGKTNLTFIFF